jgi:hypothetical protein
MGLLLFVLFLCAAGFVTLWVLRLRWGMPSFRNTWRAALARWGWHRSLSAEKLFAQMKREINNVVLTLPSGRQHAPEAIMLPMNPDDYEHLRDDYGWELLLKDFREVYLSMARRRRVAVDGGHGPSIHVDRDPDIRRGWVAPAYIWREDRPHVPGQVGPGNINATEDLSGFRAAATPPGRGAAAAGASAPTSASAPTDRVDWEDPELAPTGRLPVLTLSGGGRGPVRLLDGDVIGRGEGSDLRLDSSKVSGRHAKVGWEGGRWLIEDLGSTNGTYLNDVGLEPHMPVVVRLGDRVQFSKQVPAFVVGEDESAKPTERTE